MAVRSASTLDREGIWGEGRGESGGPVGARLCGRVQILRPPRPLLPPLSAQDDGYFVSELPLLRMTRPVPCPLSPVPCPLSPVPCPLSPVTYPLSPVTVTLPLAAA